MKPITFYSKLSTPLLKLRLSELDPSDPKAIAITAVLKKRGAL